MVYFDLCNLFFPCECHFVLRSPRFQKLLDVRLSVIVNGCQALVLKVEGKLDDFYKTKYLKQLVLKIKKQIQLFYVTIDVGCCTSLAALLSFYRNVFILCSREHEGELNLQ